MKRIIAAVSITAILCSLLSISAFAAGNINLSESEMTDGILRIEEAGAYTLTGKMEGTVYVDPGEGDVTLILDGADINGGTAPGIVAASGDSLKIRLADGSTNRIIGSDKSAEYDGAVFTMVDASFDGDGMLYIASSGQNGICSRDAELVFENGEYTMGVAKYGLAAEGNKAGSITVNGGTFRIEAQAVVDPSSKYTFNGGTMIDLTQNTDCKPYETDTESENTTDSESAQTQRNDDSESEQKQQSNGTKVPGVNPPSVPSDAVRGNGELQPLVPVQGGNTSAYESADAASEIAAGTTSNSAMELEADKENATYLTITDENNEITISSSGTYVVTGTCSDGNITVKKGTTGVVLILEDLDLTSTTGAAVSVNKNAEVQIVISGQVVLTDNENPDDETSEDETVADAYDGAALKAKANSNVYVTGDGTLVINGNSKNGIKGGDDSSIIFDGVTVNINAVNDGINSSYDVALLSGNFTIAAGDDAIHADHVVTVGSEDGTGPVINVTDCYEGIEGTVVNICGGDISIKAEDDAINAANSDGTYESEIDYSINILGGKIVLDCNGDGLDSNGNINLIDGSASISSASSGGEAGIDYDMQFYMSDSFELNNSSGIAGPDGANPNGQQVGMGQANPNSQQVGIGQAGPNSQHGGAGQTGPTGQQDGISPNIPNGQHNGMDRPAA